MSLHRQRAKRDTTEADIVKALRKVGVQVFRMSGRGLPDLLTYYRGRWGVLEVKRKGGRLTDAQKNTRVTAPFPVVETPLEALSAVGVQP